MLDKLCALNQTCFIRTTQDGKPDVHTRVVRNLEDCEGRVYGEVTIDGDEWVVRYLGNGKWQSVGNLAEQDAIKTLTNYLKGRF